MRGISLNLPADLVDRPSSYFKCFDNVINVLIYGWVEIKYLDGEATAFCDETGLFWCRG